MVYLWSITEELVFLLIVFLTSGMTSANKLLGLVNGHGVISFSSFEAAYTTASHLNLERKC